jgi:hypothetical protein
MILKRLRSNEIRNEDVRKRLVIFSVNKKRNNVERNGRNISKE